MPEEKMTQDNRLLSITTPLGKDFLMMRKLSASEALSQLYSIDIEMVHEEDDDNGYEPKHVGIETILGQLVTISVLQEDGDVRYFNGIINEFSQGKRNRRFSFYYATIVPSVWVLTQTIQSKIFQQKTVPDILRFMFQGFDVSYEISGDFKPRNYCVQYKETDFDFASRLMEEEGIYYYFEHFDGGHRMIIANLPQSHKDCPGKSELSFTIEMDEFRASAVRSWYTGWQMQSGKITLWDNNFQLPNKNLEAQQISRFKIANSENVETYQPNGGYAKKYDGIAKSGGEQASELQNIFTDNTNTVKNRMEALDANFRTSNGTSDCSTLSAGHRFTLKNHPSKEINGQYILTAVMHEAEQVPDYLTDGVSASLAYKVGFTCIPHGSGNPPFRPMVKTRKPLIYGSQTAFVVGPAGEEIFTDKYGRVKVQMLWDRDSQADESSSCWVRVAQPWAGNKWGTMFIPRIGMEVIVHFLEGDPDQPIITGCVYNPMSMPPYILPDEKTKSTIKSNSSKGGAGFNEIRFEDKKGSEQIFIHGEKDMDVRIKNDRREWTGKDQHLIVKNDRREKIDSDTHLSVGRHQMEEIKGDKHLKVAGDEAIQIGGGLSIKVSGSASTQVGANHSSEATGAYYIKGANVVIEATGGITLKVGGSFVTVNAGGVQISGPTVLINSGGAALPGMAGQIKPPTAPAEADTADDNKPGTKATLEKRSAARKERRLNPAAQAAGAAGQGDSNDPNKKKSSIDIKMIDEAGKPVPGLQYRIETPDGRIASGTLDKEGKASVKGIDPGNCKVTFPDLDQEAWEEN